MSTAANLIDLRVSINESIGTDNFINGSIQLTWLSNHNSCVNKIQCFFSHKKKKTERTHFQSIPDKSLMNWNYGFRVHVGPICL